MQLWLLLINMAKIAISCLSEKLFHITLLLTLIKVVSNTRSIKCERSANNSRKKEAVKIVFLTLNLVLTECTNSHLIDQPKDDSIWI